MSAAYVLLKCIAKAVVKNVANLFTFGVGGEIAVDAWDYWQEAAKEEERPAQVEAAARLAAAELHEEVARVVREEAAALPTEQKARVATYLSQVPATIRRSLRRPSDPAGRTAAPGATFRTPGDLLPLLPVSLPRFKAGDRPAGIGDWELVEMLGVGGFGEVWKARNPHFSGVAPVALKFCLDPAAKDRLLKHEAKIVSQVMQHGKHEGIVPLLHTYLGADPPCLAYEYIDGGDLTGLIQGQRGGGVPSPQSAQVIQRLAEIVGFAHQMAPPVVHRDLKPANILLKPRPGGKWALRITDFGIGGLAIQQAVAQSRRGTKSWEALSSAVRGAYTPLYASPQQMRGEDAIDPRDDVYALGVIWHQLLTGDLTTGRPGGEAWKKRLTDRGMTPALLTLLASCFEDRREDRPGNGARLAEALGRALTQPTPASSPASFPVAIPLLDAIPMDGPPTVRPLPAAPTQTPKPERTEPTGRAVSPARTTRKRGLALRRYLLMGGAATLLLLGCGGVYAILAHFLNWGGSGPLASSASGQPVPSDLRPHDKEFTNSIGMKFAHISPGRFMMGSLDSDAQSQYDEKPRHEVEITLPFLLGVYPVTKKQFAAFVEENRYNTAAELANHKQTWREPGFAQTDDDPVACVSCGDVADFCAWLGKKEQKTYRLPTEAEWEYACRAGTTTAYSFGDDAKNLNEYGWYDVNSEHRTHPVGQKKPNLWGLYDMHGNVWQWCADGRGPYHAGFLKDPQNAHSDKGQVARGGSWDSSPGQCRSAYRYSDQNLPALYSNDIGVRVVLSLD